MGAVATRSGRRPDQSHRQITLVSDDHAGLTAHETEHLLVRVVERLGRIQDHQDQIGRAHLFQGSLHPNCLDGVSGLANTRRVYGADRDAPDIGALSITSRVVPGISVTMARSSRRSALRRLDFPTFGRPAMTTRAPSR